MISNRRAREADFDTTVPREHFWRRRNLSATAATFQRGRGPSTGIGPPRLTIPHSGPPVVGGQPSGVGERPRRGNQASWGKETRHDHRTAHLEQPERPQDFGRARGEEG